MRVTIEWDTHTEIYEGEVAETRITREVFQTSSLERPGVSATGGGRLELTVDYIKMRTEK